MGRINPDNDTPVTRTTITLNGCAPDLRMHKFRDGEMVAFELGSTTIQGTWEEVANLADAIQCALARVMGWEQRTEPVPAGFETEVGF